MFFSTRRGAGEANTQAQGFKVLLELSPLTSNRSLWVL